MIRKPIFQILLLIAVVESGSAATNSSENSFIIPVTTITELNPYLGNDLSLNKVMNQICLTLVSLDDSHSPVPEIAKSWRIDKKKREIRFELREDAIFHDGSKITSSEIFQIFKSSLKSGSDLTTQIKNFEKCESIEKCGAFKAESQSRFSIALDSDNYAYFFRKLSGVEGSIFKRTPNGTFIGSGPFRIEEISKDKIVVARVSSPSGAQKIIFSRVTPSEAQNLFLKNKIDILNDIEFDVERDKLPQDYRRQDQVMATFGLVLNTSQNSIFNKIKARKALALAIDKKKFIDFYGRPAIPAFGLIPKGFVGYKERSSGANIAEARELIQKAVPKERRTITLALREKYRGNKALEDYLPEALKSIGLLLEIKYGTFNRLLKDFRANKYDMILKGDAPRYYESSTAFISYINGQFQNASNFKNRNLAELYYESEKETNHTKKIEILEKMEAIIRDKIPVVPLFHPVLSYWYQPNIVMKNFKKFSIRFWDFPYHTFYKPKSRKEGGQI